MEEINNQIWYASYGSNLSKDRFLCYIRGGAPSEGGRRLDGCRDKTLPRECREITINRYLYFAKSSKSWSNGGVGFIQNDFNEKANTLGRMYLITKEQFIDVIKQETRNSGYLNIDFDIAQENTSLIYKPGSWYGNLIFLGTQYDFPIFTFTYEKDLTNFNKPSPEYLRTIITGIEETYNMDKYAIVNYLIDKPGIQENYSDQELKNLFE